MSDTADTTPKNTLFTMFKTNEDLEEAGVWAVLSRDPLIRVKVRRLKSKRSLEARKELDKPFANEIRRGTLSTDEQKDLALKQIAHGVIAAWEGVTDAEGKELPYTPKNAYDILKALPELADLIIGISVEAENYKDQVRKDGEKN